MNEDCLKLEKTLNEYYKVLLNDYCILNGRLENIDSLRKMNRNQYQFFTKSSMPKKLFKYFPNTYTELVINNKEKNSNSMIINYSQLALSNGTVYLQSPINFDDVFDSELNIDFYSYKRFFYRKYVMI